ncbi:hypothetical protein [Kitasatospora sp. NPDC017646]|uniref:hypothetical protein n=1 Tax=Kitasatospora sp. NPDC017646 TaxID=3364024 RepID=UPI0037B928AC
MLTWSRQQKFAGCHLKRKHLEDLHNGATAGYSEPTVVHWEGSGWVGDGPGKGDGFRVKSSSLTSLEAEVGQKTLAALRLTVSTASEPNDPRVEITMGDLENPQGHFTTLFLGIVAVTDSRWFTRVRVCDPDVAAARDRFDVLTKTLKQSQGVRRLAGGWPWMIHVAMQTFLFWLFVDYIGLDQSGDRYLFGGMALAAVSLLSWQFFADWLVRTRLRITPTPMLWWQHLTTSPGLSGAIGAVVGVLGLVVAVISVVVTVMIA